MDVLAPADCLDDFVCPACRSDGLIATGDAVTCAGCERRFPCRRGVVDFVLADELDATGAREHIANAVELDSAKAVRRKLRKSRTPSPMLLAQMRRSIRAADRLMAGHDPSRTIVSLGSGFGFELPLLFERRSFARVYSSDLAWSSTALVPEVVHDLDGELGLFAADFDHVPMAKRPDRIGFVFLALHHTEDPHASLARLLERFDDLVLVEPLDNWFVSILARLGLARRIEYSGTRPRWLSVRRMRALARARGFEIRMETWWEIPRDVLPRRLRRSRVAWWPLYAAVEAVSYVLRPLCFGSMAAIRFQSIEVARRAAGEGDESARGAPARVGVLGEGDAVEP
ncbi:MAG TPA: hypothetical protein VMY78_14375 [Solirubrobacteraceae bacterium]|nr:hypothetical protein [Solirubrobacteraceae bacterium]